MAAPAIPFTIFLLQHSSSMESCNLALLPDVRALPVSPSPGVLDTLKKAAAPQLSSLSISFDCTRECILPNSVFRGDLSSLSRLSLTRAWFDIGELNINVSLQILHVDLSFARNTAGSHPTDLSRWLVILDTLPNLVTLELQVAQASYGPIKQVVDNASLRHLTLQHLTSVTMIITAQDLNVFLNFVHLPSCSVVRITLHVAPWDDIHTDTERLVRRYANPLPPGQAGSELTLEADSETEHFACGFVRNPPPPHPNHSAAQPPDIWFQDLSVHLIRHSVARPEVGLTETYRSFLSAWHSVTEGLATLSVLPPFGTWGPMPQDFYDPIREIVKMGCSNKGSLKRIKCAERYIGTLFGEGGQISEGGMLWASEYPLEVLPIREDRGL
ncbi:hypothetical protein FA13DRAFT_1807147 [Coprinellus micaceus]|uniref:F-box domain-containing protein n=1 Tax=Coprinellus micaceus TaxID=71717 RepID=A0A4Y7RCB1_COPMI|nr:hypothetical protein FA13DRAFT_1807147 [Coprinellus micaceus]